MKAIRTTMEIAVRFASSFISKPSCEKLAKYREATTVPCQSLLAPGGDQLHQANRQMFHASTPRRCSQCQVPFHSWTLALRQRMQSAHATFQEQMTN